MWPDNETEIDFLNFSSVADSVAEIVEQAQGQPVSIGISGAWGTGKSSLIKLTKASLRNLPREEGCRKFVFVEFNAWLYQGYDDARAALMDVIAAKLENEAKGCERATDKVKALLERVNWLRVAKLAGSAASMLMGLPPTAILGELLALGHRFTTGKIDIDLEDSETEETTKGFLNPKAKISPPKEIQALRNTFEETLDELDVTLVVLIDDLDRCLPETTISTLEAIRLFLFLKNTAFVIAADNEMIKYAVRRHFEGVPDNSSLITSYFDKLIQVPIRVPPLGTQEVRGYMMMLFVENSDVEPTVKEKIRVGICNQLRQTWQGKRVDRAFVQGLHERLPPELISQFDTAERLAPIMTEGSGISGNPRLIKRFLNAMAIRMAISNAQGVGVDEAVLVKLLLFERLGDPKAFEDLIAKISAGKTGKPAFLDRWEKAIAAGEKAELSSPFNNDSFFEEWLALPPMLADKDLRGALYVSREHMPLITPEDRLSSEAAKLLTALLQSPEMARSLKDRLGDIPPVEISVIMDRLLDEARREQKWGVPPVLEACLVVGEAAPQQGLRLAGFLGERPASQIQPNIVPKIGDQTWAESVFDKWEQESVSQPVKNAIKLIRK